MVNYISLYSINVVPLSCVLLNYFARIYFIQNGNITKFYKILHKYTIILHII